MGSVLPLRATGGRLRNCGPSSWSARGLEALPVGAWTLRVEGEDGLLFEAPIRIEAGQVTRIEW